MQIIDIIKNDLLKLKNIKELNWKIKEEEYIPYQGFINQDAYIYSSSLNNKYSYAFADLWIILLTV